VDLCIRLYTRNIPLTYVPQSRLIHRSRVEARAVFIQGFIYGRADVLLFKRHRHVGLARPGWRTVLRYWQNAAQQLLRLSLGRADSFVALHECGWAMGRMRQSIASRTIYL